MSPTHLPDSPFTRLLNVVFHDDPVRSQEFCMGNNRDLGDISPQRDPGQTLRRKNKHREHGYKCSKCAILHQSHFGGPLWGCMQPCPDPLGYATANDGVTGWLDIYSIQRLLHVSSLCSVCRWITKESSFSVSSGPTNHWSHNPWSLQSTLWMPERWLHSC